MMTPSADIYCVPLTPAPSPEPHTIYHTRIIEQTVQEIPFGLGKLPPEADGDWVGCLVQASDLERFPWFEQLPSVHVVGENFDNKFYVAVFERDIQLLRDSFPFPFEAHSTHSARERSQRRLILNAVRGIAAHGPGLGRFYRRSIRDPGLRAVIEWAILIRDVQASPPHILDRFWLCCLFVSLHLLRDPYSRAALQVLERDGETWMGRLQYLRLVKTTEPPENPKASMHEVAMLRILLECAGGTRDVRQHRFDETRSVNDNLATLGGLFDVNFEEPEFRGFDDPKVMEALLTYKPFGCGGEDVVKLEETIPHVPIAFRKELYETLPATLVNALPYNLVLAVQFTMEETYRQASCLRADRRNDLQVLLCHCMNQEVRHQAIHRWAASNGGQHWFQQTIRCLHRSGSREQVALSVTALLSYDWFSGSGDLSPALTSYSYLVGFIHNPARNGFETWKEWRHMASVRRFLDDTHVPRDDGWVLVGMPEDPFSQRESVVVVG